jgi:hypothetical protein
MHPLYEQAIQDLDITASEAEAIALAILRENALGLYSNPELLVKT